jgi:hypothetical protein
MDEDGQFVLTSLAAVRNRRAAAEEQKEQLVGQQAWLEDVESEKARIEAERARLAAEARLLEERKALEMEKLKVEQEKQRLALERERAELAAEKQQIAAVRQAPDAGAAVNAGTRKVYTVGILPFLFTGSARYLQSMKKAVAVQAAANALKDLKQIRVTHSMMAEKLDLYYPVAPIEEAGADLDQLWHQESFFSEKELNKEWAFAFGKALKVDFLITAKLINPSGGVKAGIIIFDIRNETFHVVRRGLGMFRAYDQKLQSIIEFEFKKFLAQGSF